MISRIFCYIYILKYLTQTLQLLGSIRGRGVEFGIEYIVIIYE